MRAFLARWLSAVLAVLAAAQLVPGVTVSSYTAAAIAALVLGFVNAAVRPVLTLLTLPVTILSFGLFLLVVNAACFAIAAWFVPGFGVDGFVSALLGALVVSATLSILSWLFEKAK